MQALDYDTLLAEHAAIQAAAQGLLTLTDGAVPRPMAASQALAALAALVRDHLVTEDPVIYQTIDATHATRHDALAKVTAAELDRLKQDWTDYLHHWDEAAVAARWAGFVADSRSMLGRLHDRVTRETSVLYSLAAHYAVIGVGD